MNNVKDNFPEKQDLEPVATVVADKDVTEFLAKFGDKLDENGEVIVQVPTEETVEDAGQPTVH